jgi:hypothetical protein
MCNEELFGMQRDSIFKRLPGMEIKITFYFDVKHTLIKILLAANAYCIKINIIQTFDRTGNTS